MRIVWMAEAENQLEDIYRFEALKNPRYAAEVYNKIIDETDKLLSFPEMAARERSLIDMARLYRALVVARKYKVIYRFDPIAEFVVIVSIWDCRQDPETLRDRVAEMQEI